MKKQITIRSKNTGDGLDNDPLNKLLLEGYFVIFVTKMSKNVLEYVLEKHIAD